MKSFLVSWQAISSCVNLLAIFEVANKFIAVGYIVRSTAFFLTIVLVLLHLILEDSIIWSIFPESLGWFLILFDVNGTSFVEVIRTTFFLRSIVRVHNFVLLSSLIIVQGYVYFKARFRVAALMSFFLPLICYFLEWLFWHLII
jgi:hypothetical protein